MTLSFISLDHTLDNRVEMFGYFYEVSDTLGNFLGWWPFDGGDPANNVVLTYSLLLVSDDFVSTKEHESNNSIAVYPNPSADQQTILLNFDQPIDGSIRLIDMNGKVVMNIFEGKTNIDVNIEYLPSGVYFYTITADEKSTYRYKIVKQ